MKYAIPFLICIITFNACKSDRKPLVNEVYVDSLINHYSPPEAIQKNQKEVEFWRDRITPNTPDYSNSLKYAAALVTRFHLLGNINNLKSSDSVLLAMSASFNNKEVGPIFTLVSHAILQHRFMQADSLLDIAKSMGLKKYESAASSFDVDFELGKIGQAKIELAKINQPSDFGYQFRNSKMMHYMGELDSSIAAMQKAVDNAGQDKSLALSALSNVGDLYLHAGMMNEAYKTFVTCINANPADMHSMMGIGWIALIKDNNPVLANKIFQFVATKTASPDPLFKLMAVAEYTKDSMAQLKFAKAFEQKVADPLYGNMYNKYLIQLYTGILNSPSKAVAIAKGELLNRATPQTYVWYVWALINNQQQEEAFNIYEKNVAGKPLESLELYWMGKMMRSLNKGYNANQFFKEANKNNFELNPSVVNDLAVLLKE